MDKNKKLFLYENLNTFLNENICTCFCYFSWSILLANTQKTRNNRWSLLLCLF